MIYRIDLNRLNFVYVATYVFCLILFLFAGLPFGQIKLYYVLVYFVNGTLIYFGFLLIAILIFISE